MANLMTMWSRLVNPATVWLGAKARERLLPRIDRMNEVSSRAASWLHQWRAAGAALEEVRRQELRGPSDEQALLHRRPGARSAIFAAAREIQESCREWGGRFCIIGSLAVQRWGEPRLARDVDVTLLTGFGGEPAFVDEFLATFSPRLPDARDFALRNRVVLEAFAA